MFTVVLGIHLLVCLSLVGVILMQSGKGGGLTGGAFGGATQTVFGGRGATDFITRATIGLGVAFFIASLVLALLTSTTTGGPRRGGSLLQQEAKRAAQGAAQAPHPVPGNASPTTPAPGGAPAPAGGSR